MAKKETKLPEGVFIRGNIYWVRWSDGHGTKIQESTGKQVQDTTGKTARDRERISKDNLDDVRAWVEARRTAVRQGKVPEMIAEIEKKKKFKEQNYTFGQLATAYSEDEEITSQSYWATKKYAVKELVERYGHLPVKNLIPENILKDLQGSRKKITKDVIKTAAKAGKEPVGQPISEGTIAKKFLCFSHMLTKGVSYNMVPQSLVDAAHVLEVQNPKNHRTNWLRQDECQALIKACGPLLRPIIVTAIMTGFRRGDILRLKWTDIDFRNNFIYITASKNKAKIQLAMNEKFKAMFVNLPRFGEFVFMTGEGVMFAKDFRKSWWTARKLAGIPDNILFRDLRHTFASLLVNAGISIKIIKDSLGHGSYAMTDRYTHIGCEQLQKSSAVLETVFPDDEPVLEQQAV